MVPPKGTFEAAFEAAGNMPDLSEAEVDVMEAEINKGRKLLDDPWK